MENMKQTLKKKGTRTAATSRKRSPEDEGPTPRNN